MEHGRAARSGARLRLVTSDSHARCGERTPALLLGTADGEFAALAATGAARSIIEYGVPRTPQAERRPRCCRAARNNTAPLSTGWAHFWNLEGTLHQSHAINRHNSLSRNQLDFHISLTGALTSIAQRREIRRNRGGRRLILTEGEAPRRCGGRHLLLTRAQNQDGLESAKPDLRSMFKKPGSATAEPQLWETVRGGRAEQRIKRWEIEDTHLLPATRSY